MWCVSAHAADQCSIAQPSGLDDGLVASRRVCDLPLPQAIHFALPFWLGLCLGLAPAGAWVAIAADSIGWAAITDAQWYPTIFFIALGVALWIAAFDLNYARMDVESDRENGIKSFPSKFGEAATTRTSIQLSLAWFACFAIANPMSEAYFLVASGIMAVANIIVILRLERWLDFQTTLFRASMLTGWVLLGAVMLMDPVQSLA